MGPSYGHITLNLAISSFSPLAHLSCDFRHVTPRNARKGEWFVSGETNHFHAKDSQKVVGYDTDHSCSKHGSAFTLAIAKKIVD